LQKLSDATAQPAAPQATQPQPSQQNRDAQRFNARKFRFYQEEGAAVLVEPSIGVDAGNDSRDGRERSAAC
jgi:hypothetical protein